MLGRLATISTIKLSFLEQYYLILKYNKNRLPERVGKISFHLEMAVVSLQRLSAYPAVHIWPIHNII